MIPQKVCATLKYENTYRNKHQNRGGGHVSSTGKQILFANLKPNFRPSFYTVDD